MVYQSFQVIQMNTKLWETLNEAVYRYEGRVNFLHLRARGSLDTL